MPHLRFRGIDPLHVQILSSTLASDLSQMTGSPIDHFTFELVGTTFFSQGNTYPGEQLCEVFWFDRGQALQDQVAQKITKELKVIDPEKDVVVVFTNLPKSAYYENGNHFGVK